MNNLTKKLVNINACKDAVEWIQSFSSYEEAWDKCDRGDWMLWVASKAGIDLRTLIKAGVECTKLVEHLMIDERSINALRIAERFADGVATRVELEEAAQAAHAAAAYATNAADAAYAAAYAAHDAAYTNDTAYSVAAHTADAVAYAASAAYTAAYAASADAADADADAADAASYAAYASAVYFTDTTDADSAYKETLNKCANICRQYLDFNGVGAFLESIND